MRLRGLVDSLRGIGRGGLGAELVSFGQIDAQAFDADALAELSAPRGDPDNDDGILVDLASVLDSIGGADRLQLRLSFTRGTDSDDRSDVPPEVAAVLSPSRAKLGFMDLSRCWGRRCSQ